MRNGFVQELTDLYWVLVEQVRPKKTPARCLPLSKAKSLSKAERAATAKKKKRSGGRKQFVMNTKKAKVKT